MKISQVHERIREFSKWAALQNPSDCEACGGNYKAKAITCAAAQCSCYCDSPTKKKCARVITPHTLNSSSLLYDKELKNLSSDTDKKPH